MNYLKTFQVFPVIPKPLSFLEILSHNLWWSWHTDAIELFRRINPRLWSEAGHNPILFGTLIPPERMGELAEDESFLAHLNRVKERFVKEVLGPVDHAGSFYDKQGAIGYFSMEFGIHESLPIFAGGLGVLAGDHLKAVSDMGVPLVGVGLLYRQGYFHQILDQDGQQQEAYPVTDFYMLPMSRAKDPAGNEVMVSISGPDGEVFASIWKVSAGRIPIYLLDTYLADNPPESREITGRLYAGEPKMRLAQEVLLGIGGVRALEALGFSSTICHLNEGHSAFSSLERVAQTMSQHDVDLQTALEIVPRTMIFTTHTPLAAGHDEFPPDLVKPYLAPLQERLGAKTDEILSWGQPQGSGPEAPFSMFVLGLRMSQYHNGVSELHGQVARRMWSHVWPGWPEDEIPISHITNGVHIPSWISVENALLFERYLGPDWYLNSWNPESVKRIDEIYAEELWRAREMSRSRLVRNCRKLMIKHYQRRNAPKVMMVEAESALDADILTIGFARRFAAYKRATLLLKDPARLEAIINSETHPVQFIFAGKAHPKDNEGKALIKRIIEFGRRTGVGHRFIFLEDYDISISRHLIQGSDIWLNTPRRPMEACGTSGMKAAVNGVINVSILDGWWCEGYSSDRGWAIGRGEEFADPEYQDSIESQALYNVLENDVIPCFYDRKNGETPNRWISMMKESMKMVMGSYCAHHMARKYEKKFYVQAIKQSRKILSNQAETSKRLVTQRQRLGSLWKNIKVDPPIRMAEGPFLIGQSFQVTAEVTLGELRPEEVEVELYYGRIKTIDSVSDGQTEPMAVLEDRGNGVYQYGCTLICEITGRIGFTVRVIPTGDARIRYTPGLITWAQG